MQSFIFTELIHILICSHTIALLTWHITVNISSIQAHTFTLTHTHARLTPGAAAWLKSSAEVVGAESDPGRSVQHWQAKRSVRIRMEEKVLLGGGSPPVSIATVMPLWPHSITLLASLPPVCLLHCLQCFGVFRLWAVCVKACRHTVKHPFTYGKHCASTIESDIPLHLRKASAFLIQGCRRLPAQTSILTA